MAERSRPYPQGAPRAEWEASALQALREAVRNVLDTMFFCDAMERAATPPIPAGSVGAKIVFGGDVQGCLIVLVSKDAACQLAADFFGRADDLRDDRLVLDVVCELANMLCGAALSRIQPNGALKLSRPEPFETDQSTLNGKWQACSFDADYGRLDTAILFAAD